MTKYKCEKRRHTRIIFNERNKVQALLSLTDDKQHSEKLIPASVLNMSEGGMQISIVRKDFEKAQQGDMVTLRQIIGMHELALLTELPMQIIWIMDNEYLEHVLLGMCFGTISPQQHQALRAFVENRLAQSLEKNK